MLSSIFRQLKIISHSKWYWLALIAGCSGLLITALYFQFVLEELPCLMCIQVRLLLFLLLIVSVVGLFFQQQRIVNSLTHLSTVVIAIALVERSYLLLGTERGFVFADCGFSLGLPQWLAVEQWMPWLFQVETSCGYTPEILFGITMAESLMLMSVLLVIFSACIFIASFSRWEK